MINWNVVETGSNIVLTAALVGITGYYANQVKKQVGFIENDRYCKEMECLVSPLYAKKDNHIIFMKGVPGYRNSADRTHQEYFEFWDSIKKYMYLGSDVLRNNLHVYFDCKSNTVRDREEDEDYIIAKRKLIESITNRYEELENKIN
ncbi:hypothetical protein [Methanococcoides burtonii]|uniref:hypothetical protein n=1 Tax=Methanococcoides burtonii TaxID=29291 RepID=UPI00064E8FA1|nr:hypothetical protein [Methanococcoides burtonii]